MVVSCSLQFQVNPVFHFTLAPRAQPQNPPELIPEHNCHGVTARTRG